MSKSLNAEQLCTMSVEEIHKFFDFDPNRAEENWWDREYTPPLEETKLTRRPRVQIAEAMANI